MLNTCIGYGVVKLKLNWSVTPIFAEFTYGWSLFCYFDCK